MKVPHDIDKLVSVEQTSYNGILAVLVIFQYIECLG